MPLKVRNLNKEISDNNAAIKIVGGHFCHFGTIHTSGRRVGVSFQNCSNFNMNNLRSDAQYPLIIRNSENIEVNSVDSKRKRRSDIPKRF